MRSGLAREDGVDLTVGCDGSELTTPHIARDCFFVLLHECFS